ncbi:GNAT family N-acetyltransferase [Streptomyces caniferus]|uniref:GNAT family N-acetyltransferase n=1 Tax=Streptomyces caniferus TaxID=285557 RepID=UPI0033FA5ED7
MSAGSTSAHSPDWTLRSAATADIELIAELRATVMRADLERLGRYDEHRVRQRLRDGFSTRHTSIIVIDRALAGCVTVRPAEGRQWMEHFYLAPHVQGRGLGSAVLRTVLERTDAQGMTVGLNVRRRGVRPGARPATRRRRQRAGGRAGRRAGGQAGRRAGGQAGRRAGGLRLPRPPESRT